MTFRLQRVTLRPFLTIFLNFGDRNLWRREAVLSFRKMLTFRGTLLHLTIIPWNCGQQVLWKSPCIYNNLHDVTSQKTVQFCAERTSVLYLPNLGWHLKKKALSKMKISGLQTASIIMQDAASHFLPLWRIKHFTNERHCFVSTYEDWRWWSCEGCS
jgi:hypothetical protein